MTSRFLDSVADSAGTQAVVLVVQVRLSTLHTRDCSSLGWRYAARLDAPADARTLTRRRRERTAANGWRRLEVALRACILSVCGGEKGLWMCSGVEAERLKFECVRPAEDMEDKTV